MKRELTVAVVLDAFRSDYLEMDANCFLSKLSRKGTVTELLPTFAFEPDLAYLTGLLPEESDAGTHFWFSPDTSPFRFLRNYGKLLDRLDPCSRWVLRNLIRLRMKRSEFPGLRSGGYTAQIPFQLLPYFDYRHYWDLDDRQFFEGSTIFDELRASGKSWQYFGYPKTSSRAVDVANVVYDNGCRDADLVFLMISDLDHVGHASGPKSIELQQVFGQLNATLRQLFNYFLSQSKGLEFIVFGDHGMTEVRKVIDIHEVLGSLKSKPGVDYVHFLDSTLARFWFLNEGARSEVGSALSKVEGGRLVSEQDRSEYAIRYPHNKFGEMIFWADGGTLIFPNFFEARIPERGMHGYRNEVEGNHSILLHWSSMGRELDAKGPPQSIAVVHEHLREALRLS